MCDAMLSVGKTEQGFVPLHAETVLPILLAHGFSCEFAITPSLAARSAPLQVSFNRQQRVTLPKLACMFRYRVFLEGVLGEQW